MVCNLDSGLELIGEVGKPTWGDICVQNCRVVFEFFLINLAYEAVPHGGAKCTYMHLWFQIKDIAYSKKISKKRSK